MIFGDIGLILDTLMVIVINLALKLNFKGVTMRIKILKSGSTNLFLVGRQTPLTHAPPLKFNEKRLQS